MRAVLDTEQQRGAARAPALAVPLPSGEVTRAKTELLEADVARLRTDAHRAMAERNAAESELERLRRAPASHA